jgi:hypothetical protein
LEIDAGILGGLVGTLLPISFWSQISGSHEAPFPALVLLLLLLIATTPHFPSGQFPPGAAVKIGLIAGLAVLVSAVVIPVLLAWVLWTVPTTGIKATK